MTLRVVQDEVVIHCDPAWSRGILPGKDQKRFWYDDKCYALLIWEYNVTGGGMTVTVGPRDLAEERRWANMRADK